MGGAQVALITRTRSKEPDEGGSRRKTPPPSVSEESKARERGGTARTDR